MDKLLGFFKDNGLGILTSIATANPAPAAMSIIGNLVGLKSSDKEITPEAIMDRLKEDRDTMIMLQQVKVEKYKLEVQDRISAREAEVKISTSEVAGSFNRNFKGIFAILVLLGTFAVVIADMTADYQISDFVLGSVLGYTMSVVGYYFGSSEIKS